MTAQPLVPKPPYMVDALHRAVEIANRPVVDLPARPVAHHPSVDAVVEAALAELLQAAPDGSGLPEAGSNTAAGPRPRRSPSPRSPHA